jgi:Arc/MetJ-type ribon-helix-helix transcriptional regulator
MSAVMREAFREWLENHKEVDEYIEANRSLLEKARQAQEAEKA